MTDDEDTRPADPFDVPPDHPDRPGLLRMTVFANLVTCDAAWAKGAPAFLQTCDDLARWIETGATQPPGKPPTKLQVVSDHKA